jgi:osmoprotectant transport system permease protein
VNTLVDTVEWWGDNSDRMGAALSTHVQLTLVSLGVATVLGMALGVLAARVGSVLGFLVVQIALVAVGTPPILVNTFAGIRSVDRGALEAARGMGMSGLQVLGRVQLPLALPLVLAGLSTAAVQIVSTATLAALIGGGGLGEVVFNGIATIRNEIILAGVLPIAALALLVEGLFRLAGRYATPKGLRFT